MKKKCGFFKICPRVLGNPFFASVRHQVPTFILASFMNTCKPPCCLFRSFFVRLHNLVFALLRRTADTWFYLFLYSHLLWCYQKTVCCPCARDPNFFPRLVDNIPINSSSNSLGFVFFRIPLLLEWGTVICAYVWTLYSIYS